jgi:hypothetical protein
LMQNEGGQVNIRIFLNTLAPRTPPPFPITQWLGSVVNFRVALDPVALLCSPPDVQSFTAASPTWIVFRNFLQFVLALKTPALIVPKCSEKFYCYVVNFHDAIWRHSTSFCDTLPRATSSTNLRMLARKTGLIRMLGVLGGGERDLTGLDGELCKQTFLRRWRTQWAKLEVSDFRRQLEENFQ